MKFEAPRQVVASKGDTVDLTNDRALAPVVAVEARRRLERVVDWVAKEDADA